MKNRLSPDKAETCVKENYIINKDWFMYLSSSVTISPILLHRYAQFKAMNSPPICVILADNVLFLCH